MWELEDPTKSRPRLRRGLTLAGVAVLSATTALATGPLSRAIADPAPIQAQVSLPSFAPIVSKVLPAVVNISVVEKNGQASDDEADDDDQGPDAAPDEGPGPGMPGPGTPFDQFLKRFFQQGPNGQPIPMPTPQGQQMALGSGFIIDPAGYIVTNNHVVGNADRMTVIFQDGSRHKAKLVGKDAHTDLALIKIDAPKPLPYVEWGDSDQAKVGDWVLAVGDPFGLGGTVTSGIVSARGRSLGQSSYVDYLQIDAPVNRGNSGGPTFDLSGHVIGINTAIYSPNGGNVGIAFSIPSDTARSVIDQLKSSGKVARGFLGVEIQEVTPSLASALGIGADEPKGALVAEINKDGPAAKAGIEPGDVIQKFDGKTVDDMKALPRLVAAVTAGKSVEVDVLRHGKSVALQAKIDNLSDTKMASADGGAEHAKAPSLGVTLGELTSDARQRLGLQDTAKGVLVARVANDSPAANVGVEAGDVIEQINGKPVSTLEEAKEQLATAKSEAKKPVLLLLDRHGAERFVAVPPEDGQG
jgi:serine protease Do